MRDARRVGDQILAHLDQAMGKAVHAAMGVHGVAFQRAIIGLVVADTEAGFTPECRQQKLRGARVTVPQYAAMPRTLTPIGQSRREGMQRDDQRRLSRGGAHCGNLGVNGRVIGPEKMREPMHALAIIQRAIAGNQSPVIDLADQGRVILAAIGIDQQPRKCRHHSRHLQLGGQRPGQRFDADIIGDVALKFAFRQAQRAIGGRKTPHGMVCHQQQTRLSITGNYFKRLKSHNALRKHVWWREQVAHRFALTLPAILPKRKPMQLTCLPDAVLPMRNFTPVLVRSLIGAIVMLAAVAAGSTAARADLRICNDTDVLAGVAIAYRAEAGWITEGWWHVEGGSCKTLIEGPLQSRYYYLYGEDAQRGGRWTGPINMCIAEREFKIVGFEDCFARGFQVAGFQEHDTGNQTSWMIQLTDRQEAPAATAPQAGQNGGNGAAGSSTLPAATGN
jgi:uncharacterized membrane protein